MKWSDPRLVKAYFVLMALASVVLAVLAEAKWH